MKVVFFIDGFNLYHALNDNCQMPHLRFYKWVNFAKLAGCYITKKDQIGQIYFFTALTTWSQDKMNRHKILIKAQEHNGVSTVYGEFKRRDKFCNLCKKTYKTFEEKQTDVNIAIHLFREAIKETYDKAILISGDSDLIPSIKAVHQTFPNKQIGVVIPIGRSSNSLKQVCDFHIKMKEMHLKSSMLPREIDLGEGQTIRCPDQWWKDESPHPG